MTYYQQIIELNPDLMNNSKLIEKNSENLDYNDILSGVDGFLNDNAQDLEVKSIKEAKMCFHAMKDIYNNRMREYVSELNYISNKLEKYDEILSKKLFFFLSFLNNFRKNKGN